MAKINLCVSSNTLKVRINLWVSTFYFRALAVEQHKVKVEKLKTARTTAEGLVDTIGGEDYLKKVEKALAEEEARYKAVLALPEAKFAYDTDADKALKKEWKSATTEAMRASAMRKWLEAYGVPCPEGSDRQILDLVSDLTHKKKNTARNIITKGQKHAVEANLSMPTLYAIMTDWHFDANLMKSGLIPEELKDIYDAQAAEAKARREAKKANKASK